MSSICLSRAPGSQNASGYTQQLIDSATRCDRARILAFLNQNPPACSIPVVGKNNLVPASSSLELKKQQSCQINGPEAFLLPKAGVPEGVRIQHRIDDLIRCAKPDPREPNRFLFRYPGPVITVCPPTVMAQPPAPLIGCQPSRFF